MKIEITKPNSSQTLNKNPRNVMAAIPANINEFTCIGVNVTGEGIPPLTSARTICSGTSYLGVYAGTVPISGGAVEVMVPSGKNRKIQVFGLSGTTNCPTSDQILQPAPVGGQTLYEIGQKTIDILADVVVDIQSDYISSSPKTIFCDGSLWDVAIWDQSIWGD